MKVLLKTYGGKYYVWKDAVYEKNRFQITNDNGSSCLVDMKNILSVDGGSTNGYVICNNCGALIENTPENIEKHFLAEESKKKLLEL